jgi:hypothetical protein
VTTPTPDATPLVASADYTSITTTSVDPSVLMGNLKFGKSLKTKLKTALLAKTTYRFNVTVTVAAKHASDNNRLQLRMAILGSNSKSAITNGFITTTSGVANNGTPMQNIRYEGFFTPKTDNEALTVAITETKHRQIVVARGGVEFSKVQFGGVVASVPVAGAEPKTLLKLSQSNTASTAKPKPVSNLKKK